MSIRTGGRANRRNGTILIHDVTLSADGKFDIQSIPLGYDHIKIVGLVRTDGVAGNDNLHMYFNNDTTLTNYRRGVHSSGTNHTVGVADTPHPWQVAASLTPANYFSIISADIPFYASDKNKLAYAITSHRATATLMEIHSINMHWENTAVINRITVEVIDDPTHELIIDSRLQVWLTRDIMF